MDTSKSTVTGEERIVKPGFRARVYAAVKRVPRGTVTTYGDVGGALGSRRVARQVGFALAALSAEEARVVPWQRVINSQGMISHRGEFFRAEQQRKILEHEGIEFDANGKVVDFDHKRFRFPAPKTAHQKDATRSSVKSKAARKNARTTTTQTKTKTKQRAKKRAKKR